MKFLKMGYLRFFHLALFLVICQGTAVADPLESLERERAGIIATALDNNMSEEKRREKIRVTKDRLFDLERVFLRKEFKPGSIDEREKYALQHYELTFLVHSSLETSEPIISHWLTSLGITTEMVIQSKFQRR